MRRSSSLFSWPRASTLRLVLGYWASRSISAMHGRLHDRGEFHRRDLGIEIFKAGTEFEHGLDLLVGVYHHVTYGRAGHAQYFLNTGGKAGMVLNAYGRYMESLGDLDKIREAQTALLIRGRIMGTKPCVHGLLLDGMPAIVENKNLHI